MKQPWIEFIYNSKVIAAYTVEGTFPGELKATKELLAAEHGTTPEAITTRHVMK